MSKKPKKAIKIASLTDEDDTINGNDYPIKKICDNGKVIRYVYHVSDIHIWNHDRKKEYVGVLKNTVEEMKSDVKKKGCKGSSIMTITGDTLQSRSSITGMAEGLVKKLFREISEIMPIIIIPGNHDCNMMNKKEDDIITSILKDCPYDVHYITETGTYQYNNIVFGITDVRSTKILKRENIDDDEINKLKYEEEDVIIIALYHGTLQSAKLDNGYMNFSLTNPKICEFDGYDIVMLGDIHKHQYLNKKKTIAYAGSLIQQSHGESLEGHGVLIWDLKTRTSKLKKIHNDYGFVTLNIEKGLLCEDMEEMVIPKHPRLRFNTVKTDIVIAEKIMNGVASEYNAEDKKLNMITKTKRIDIVSGNNEHFDMTDVNQQIIQIVNYIDKQTIDDEPITKQIKNVIIELHKEITKKIHEKNIYYTKDRSWRLLEMKFSNIFCYDKENVIDFRDFPQNKVVGIIAGNHSGKSSIVDMILHAICDKCSRGGSTRDIVNNNSDWMICSLLVEVGSKKYRIIKGCDISGIGRAKNTTRLFEINDDYSEHEITKGNKLETDNAICQMLGTYDDIVATSICTQNDPNHFINKSPIEKNNLICGMLRLDTLEDYKKQAKTELKIIEDEMDEYLISMNNKKLSDLKDELNEIGKQMDSLCIKESEKIKNPVKQKNISLPIELDKYSGNSSEELITIIQELKDQAKKNTDYIKNNKQIDHYRNTLKELNEKYPRQLLKTKLEKYEKVINALNREFIPGTPLYVSKSEIIRLNHILTNKTNYGELLKWLIEQYDLNVEKMGIENVIINLTVEKKMLENKIIKVGNYSLDKLITDVEEFKDNMVIKQITLADLKNNVLDDNDRVRLKQESKCIKEYMNNCKMTINSLNEITIVDKTITKIINGVINTNQKWIDAHTMRITEINGKLNNDKSKEKIIDLENEIDSLMIKINGHYQLINNIKSNNKIEWQLIDIQIKIDLCNYYCELLQECNRSRREIRRLENNGSIRDKINLINEKIYVVKGIENNIEELTKNISVFDNGLNELRLLEEYQPKLKKWEEENNKYLVWRDEINNIGNNIKNCIEKYCELNEYIEEFKIIQESYENLKRSQKIYKFYIDMMSNKKLPGTILKNYLPIIEAEVNNIIKNYTNFRIEIRTDKDSIYKVGNKTNNAGIDIFLVRPKEESDKTKGNRTHVSYSSGFEKFITSMSFRIAFQKTLNIGKPNFCIIDEGWSCLDKKNRENIHQIIDILKDHYEHVIIISHLDELSDEIKYPIIIERDTINNTSHIDTKRINIHSQNEDECDTNDKNPVKIKRKHLKPEKISQ